MSKPFYLFEYLLYGIIFSHNKCMFNMGKGKELFSISQNGRNPSISKRTEKSLQLIEKKEMILSTEIWVAPRTEIK